MITNVNKNISEELLFLDEPSSFWSNAGQKAGNLARLWQLGLNIPAGFACCVADETTSLSSSDIEACVQEIGGFPVAVRSSGAAEDGEEASFAGQFESFLNIHTAQELLSSIEKCRLSFNSNRVNAYSGKLNQSHGERAFQGGSVLIQKMVDAKVSGVLFSIDPLSGNEYEAVIECTLGLGHDILSGSKTPSTYWLNLHSCQVKKHLGQDILDRNVLIELRELALKIQAFFGRPQDIEWAVDQQNRVFILQARPITKISWRHDVDEFSNAYFRDGGVSARICTPLMASLYEHAFQDSMQEYAASLGLIGKNDPYHWVDTFYGRPYWNAAAVKRSMYKVPGFKEQDFDLDIGVKKNYGPRGPQVIPTTPYTVLRAIPVAAKLALTFAKQKSKIKKIKYVFARDSESYLDKIKSFATQNDSYFFRDFKQVLSQFHYAYEKANFTMAYIQSNAQSELHSLVTKIDSVVGGKTDMLALLSGFPDSGYHKMQTDLGNLQRLAKLIGAQSKDWIEARDAFLKEYYFRGSAELDISVPRWSEDPAKFDHIIQGLLDSQIEPVDMIGIGERQFHQYIAEKKSVIERISQKTNTKLKFKNSFLTKLERARQFLFLREEMRELSVKNYFIVRKYVEDAARRLTLAGLLQSRSDVYMLNWRELIDRSSQNIAVDFSEIQFRKWMYEGYRNLVPPDDFGYQPSSTPHAQSSNPRKSLQGIGCSRGQVEGIARVILDVEDATTLKKGEILVTKFTDPGWTPALGIAVGVVTEIGGLLSHAAVISREYGIPAVLNVSEATKKIQSGQLIRVDGAQGTVEIVETRAKANKLAPKQKQKTQDY